MEGLSGGEGTDAAKGSPRAVKGSARAVKDSARAVKGRVKDSALVMNASAWEPRTEARTEAATESSQKHRLSV